MDFRTLLIDYGLFEVILSYLVNLLAIISIIKFAYDRLKTNNKYVMSFYLVNTIVFFICFLFIKSNVSLGFTFGVFAIFSLMRYKSKSIEIVEMTFFFLCIGIAFINALCVGKTGVPLLIFANICIVGFCIFLSRLRHINEKSIKIIYHNVDVLHPNNRGDLYSDLSKVLHESVYKVEVLEIDFEKNKSILNVYYL